MVISLECSTCANDSRSRVKAAFDQTPQKLLDPCIELWTYQTKQRFVAAGIIGMLKAFSSYLGGPSLIPGLKSLSKNCKKDLISMQILECCIFKSHRTL